MDEDKLNPRKNQNLSSEKSVAKSQKIQDAKQRAIADKVIGQRASRIARLLELWEKQPIEGIMTGEDVKREREKELREAEKEKELRRIEAEELKKISEAKIGSKEKEVSKQKEPEVVAPVVEQAITMELLSPLGEVGTKSEKLIEVGSFKTGDIGQNNKTKESISSEKEKKKSKTKNRKSRKKKVRKTSFLRESYELNVARFEESKIDSDLEFKSSKNKKPLVKAPVLAELTQKTLNDSSAHPKNTKVRKLTSETVMQKMYLLGKKIF